MGHQVMSLQSQHQRAGTHAQGATASLGNAVLLEPPSDVQSVVAEASFAAHDCTVSVGRSSRVKARAGT